MAVLTSTGITFSDSTTQSTAATAVSTALDGIGTYSILIMAADNNLAMGSTIAGSSLRYNYTPNTTGASVGNSSTIQARSADNTTYNGGGVSLSGTWRRMSSGTIFTSNFDPDSQITTKTYFTSLYVRIS